MPTATYHWRDDRPELKLWLRGDDKTLVTGLGAGYTFALYVGSGTASTLTKTSGITGQTGSGESPDGTPNCIVTWTAGEIAAAFPNVEATYEAQIVASTSSLDRTWSFDLRIRRSLV